MNKKNSIRKTVETLMNYQPQNIIQARLKAKILISALSGCRVKQLNTARTFCNQRLWIAQIDSKTGVETGDYVPLIIPKTFIEMMRVESLHGTDLCGTRDLESDANNLLKKLGIPANEVASIEETPLFCKYCMEPRLRSIINDQMTLWNSSQIDLKRLARVSMPNELDHFDLNSLG